ncbi:hypothetical protein EDD86DRAFT_276520 [Gorgonomyces haynaldii]|nr:hypothetical protein EDD86DRAFT_276520 [Gorgonomyces haynaldii]
MLSFLISAAAVAAHFSLTSPPARGNEELDMEIAPCGGFNDPTTPTAVSVAGNAQLTIADKSASLVINAGPNTDSLVQVGAATFSAIGRYPVAYDLSKVKGLKNGDNLVFQVVLEGSHGKLYACADVSVTGVQETTLTTVISSSATSSATEASSTTAAETTAATSAATSAAETKTYVTLTKTEGGSYETQPVLANSAQQLAAGAVLGLVLALN